MISSKVQLQGSAQFSHLCSGQCFILWLLHNEQNSNRSLVHNGEYRSMSWQTWGLAWHCQHLHWDLFLDDFCTHGRHPHKTRCAFLFDNPDLWAYSLCKFHCRFWNVYCRLYQQHRHVLSPQCWLRTDTWSEPTAPLQSGLSIPVARGRQIITIVMHACKQHTCMHMYCTWLHGYLCQSCLLPITRMVIILLRVRLHFLQNRLKQRSSGANSHGSCQEEGKDEHSLHLGSRVDCCLGFVYLSLNERIHECAMRKAFLYSSYTPTYCVTGYACCLHLPILVHSK